MREAVDDFEMIGAIPKTYSKTICSTIGSLFVSRSAFDLFLQLSQQLVVQFDVR